MRTDLNGSVCPATLGEYWDLVRMRAPASAALVFLTEAIATSGGRDHVVTETHEAYMTVLQPLIVQPPGVAFAY